MPSAEYMRSYRERSPSYQSRNRKLSHIRKRALAELADNHATELRTIVVRMCREEGITPPRES
jgi:hypothetical protein